ncbi:MAG: hypothetical protein OHK0022_30190 [Roseiflexaceae bacterium]
MSDKQPMSMQEKRALLARLLGQAMREGRSNLTPEQQRLWFLQQLDASATWHVLRACELRGPYRPELLQQSLDALVAGHDLLRAAFMGLEGYPVQLNLPEAQLEPTVVDLRGQPEHQQHAALQHLAHQVFRQTISLQQPPLLQISVVHLAEERHALLLVMHQLIADEATATLLVEQVAQQYAARLAGAEPPPVEQGLPFARLAAGMLDDIRQGRLAERLDAWRARLADAPTLPMPLDHPRPALKTYTGRHLTRAVSPALLARLDQVARQLDFTVPLIVLASFQALLARSTHTTDIVLGLFTGAQRPPSLRQTLGPLSNTLVLRTDLGGEPTFRELLARVHTAHQQALESEVPLELLIQELQPQRDASSTPLFQIAFGERVPGTLLSQPALSVAPLRFETGVARYDATLFVEYGEQLLLELEFNTDLFEETTAERLLGQLLVILGALVDDLDQPFTTVPLLTEEMRHRLLVEWNQTAQPLGDTRWLYERIADHAQYTPDAAAVVAGSQTQTFADLGRRVDELAGLLRTHGIAQEQLVAVCCERTVDVPALLLAVLKAGGAYVPIDPHYPDERVGFILGDTTPQVIVTQQHLRDRIQGIARSCGVSASVLCLDTPQDEQPPAVVGAPEGPASPDSLAYIIYTSGSTGQPKGAMITHRGLLNYLSWAVRRYEASAGVGAPLASSLSFDLTVTSLFVPLLAGRTVTLLDDQGPEALGNMLRQSYNASLVKLTPAHLDILSQQIPDQGKPNRTRFFVIGGEELHYSALRSWRSAATGTMIINEYGPTETVVGCCTYQVGPDDPVDGPVPIGRPIANTQLYVLDEQLQPLPVGVAGELFIGGAGVARGYHRRPGLTAERFVPDPFGCEPGSRLYRTGDLVRYRVDGILEFLGRIDRQVKIHGYRIELGEIEATLLRHPEIAQAAVEAPPGPAGDRQLVAYVVARRAGPDLPQQVTAFLSAHLPTYMLPAHIIPLDSFPQTPNGKIDRKALPLPKQGPAAAADSAPTDSPLEAEIAQIVTQMLGLETLGRHDSIFDHGATSLLVARLSARLSDHYEIDPSLHEMFQVPTIAGLARMVDYFRQRYETVPTESWTWETERLAAEALLDADITPEGLPTTNYLNPANVLLTGVTGYLGAFLLETLLRRTNATVYCLVRSKSPERALERIKSNLELYQIWNDAFAARIRPVCGDLGQQRLGLSPETFAQLAVTIDAIYHSGALVNFTYPYDALKRPNVQGTAELLRLACHSTRKAFHYLSTLDVYLMTTTPRPFLETDLPAEPVTVPDGYMRTKWISEKLITTARDRGLPVTIHRPGFLIGHSANGASATTNYIIVALKGFLELGVLPQLSDILNIAPVDYAAEAIVYLAGKPSAYGKHYHLWNLAPVPMNATYPWIRSFGYDFEVLPYNLAHQRALNVMPDHPLYPILPLLALNTEFEEYPETSLSPHVHATIDLRSECAVALAELEHSGIECPPMSEEMIHRCLAYLVEIGYLPPPQHGPYSRAAR